ncbi:MULTISPECIES: hypothetical protein [Actinomycetes]|uniref:hypothetical protein n=1 Tax=Actinomycetes TaxID=1760 RepID=UPI0001B57A5C|nr:MULTISPECIES: hypothetical protein [Actinomycetes]
MADPGLTGGSPVRPRPDPAALIDAVTHGPDWRADDLLRASERTQLRVIRTGGPPDALTVLGLLGRTALVRRSALARLR